MLLQVRCQIRLKERSGIDTNVHEDNASSFGDVEYFSIEEDEEYSPPKVYALYVEFYNGLCNDEVQNLENYLETD